jgi:cytidyltransferase-like protein
MCVGIKMICSEIIFMKKVFVSGCYDIIHGGHVEFFNQAKALGGYLVVCFASDEVLKKYKGRTSALPEKHKKYLLENIRAVDEVVMSSNLDDPIFDFKDHFLRIKPQILAITEDDKHIERKRAFCKEHGAELVVLPKSLNFEKISTTELRQRILEEK